MQRFSVLLALGFSALVGACGSGGTPSGDGGTGDASGSSAPSIVGSWRAMIPGNSGETVTEDVTYTADGNYMSSTTATIPATATAGAGCVITTMPTGTYTITQLGEGYLLNTNQNAYEATYAMCTNATENGPQMVPAVTGSVTIVMSSSTSFELVTAGGDRTTYTRR